MSLFVRGTTSVEGGKAQKWHKLKYVKNIIQNKRLVFQVKAS